jgi:hypothetical protein
VKTPSADAGSGRERATSDLQEAARIADGLGGNLWTGPFRGARDFDPRRDDRYDRGQQRN